MKVLKKFFLYIITIPIIVVLVILSTINKHDVVFFFNPIANKEAIFQINAPLYLYIFTAFLAGTLVGYLIAKTKKIKKNNQIIKVNT